MNLMDFINGKVISSVVQYILGIVGASLVSGGILTQSQVSDATGALLVLVGIVWSVLQAKGHATVSAAVANSGQKVVGNSTASATLVKK